MAARASNDQAKKETWPKRNICIVTGLAFILGSGAVLGYFRWTADHYVNDLVDARLKGTQEALGAQTAALKTHGESIARIEGKVDGLAAILTPALLGQMLKVASTSPADPRNQRAARELINIALRGAIQIQTMIIADAGVRFVEGVDSESWEVGMEFLGYDAEDRLVRL